MKFHPRFSLRRMSAAARRAPCRLAVLPLLAALAPQARSEVLYATQLSTSTIAAVDTVANTVTPVFTTVGTPDSLLFDAHGNIVYTNLGSGQVRLYNVTTHNDTVLATGLNDPADLALEPGGGSLLVSDFGSGILYRINLSNNAISPLGTYAIRGPQGLAFDAAGRLFAVLGTRGSGATSFVARLDRNTGAILGQTPFAVSLDGLTFDAYSGKLYASAGPAPGAGIYVIDPGNLASMALLPNTGALDFDGITTDSAGHLYLAHGGASSQVYQYDLATGTLTPQTPVPGLDDLAPLTGLGAETGFLEICKASDPNHPVDGTYTFTASNGGFSSAPVTVPVGQCSGPIQVPSGTVTIAETPVPGVAVSSASAYAYDEFGFQYNELLSWSPPNLSGTVHVSPGDLDEETLATVTNYAAGPGQLKLCKIAGDKSTLGKTFTFTVTANGQPQVYAVQAGPASQGGNCVLAGTFPVSTQVTIAETPQPPYVPSSLTVSEGSLSACRPASIHCAVATTVPGFTEVTFTNRVGRRGRQK